MSELWYLKIFEGVRRECDVKYDVRYHKIAQNVIQIVLRFKNAKKKRSDRAEKLYRDIFSPEEHKGPVRILIYWLFDY